MNTAISIPVELFKKTEQFAKKLGQSRSEFYVDTIREFMARQNSSEVTEKLNELYSSHPSTLDEDVKGIQQVTIKKVFKREA